MLYRYSYKLSSVTRCKISIWTVNLIKDDWYIHLFAQPSSRTWTNRSTVGYLNHSDSTCSRLQPLGHRGTVVFILLGWSLYILFNLELYQFCYTPASRAKAYYDRFCLIFKVHTRHEKSRFWISGDGDWLIFIFSVLSAGGNSQGSQRKSHQRVSL